MSDTLNCPSCLAAMTSRVFERRYGPPITIDLCQGCQGIWFDNQELLQLTPGATLELLGLIAGVESQARVQLAVRLGCPRCTHRLTEVHDLQRTTRFSYFRCPEAHGRFLTYYQFLRAKNFVRSLAVTEVDELRKHIRQVNCSNCGAPVDIERGAACGYCRTPIAILDPDQVRKAVAELRTADQEEKTIAPDWPLRVMMERVRAERVFAEAGENPDGFRQALRADSTDLLATGLQVLKGLLG
ncbi:MAG TPA: zf-TFIIB domain-containing protein [Vicinamibacterales bacterium]|jgi:hypothetical protein